METELSEKLERIEKRIENMEKEFIELKLKVNAIFEFFNFKSLKSNGFKITGIYIAFILGNISGLFFLYNIIGWVISLIKK